MSSFKHARTALFGLTFVLIMFMSNGLFAAFGQSTNFEGPFVGVAMKGAYVDQKENREDTPLPPATYFDESFRLLSEAGLNHVRFLFYWEAYEKNPQGFMNELEQVANAADKYGIKVIYDNHQWHTSSWLEKRGTGFPTALFANNSQLYPMNSGGKEGEPVAKLWWSNFWDGTIKDGQGNDAWTLLADFYKKVVAAVDSHESTLGYEILSEPHVEAADQWEKIGSFNSFMTDELRSVTQKIIVYSMNVPVDLNGPIQLTAENLAEMAPANKDNVWFKISVYGIPDRDQYQQERFDLFLQTRELTGIPLYIGEWNNVVRTQVNGVFQLDPQKSGLNQQIADTMLEAFKNENITASAFWKWDYQDADTASFNLLSPQNATLMQNQNATLTPTEYYTFLKNSVANVYGDLSTPTSVSSSEPTSDTTSDATSEETSEATSETNSTEEN
ncbi:MAG TPA: cellulase family glycosylhydrolase [Nitrososphaeraceae archaeon]|nr:cellulase family glycosylhydrolase [Nitrososphaeraceae archaeon]